MYCIRGILSGHYSHSRRKKPIPNNTIIPFVTIDTLGINDMPYELCRCLNLVFVFWYLIEPLFFASIRCLYREQKPLGVKLTV